MQKKSSITASVDTLLARKVYDSIRVDDRAYDTAVITLGIGLVIAPSGFTLFSDSLLASKFADYNMYADSDTMAIRSKYFKPDYGIMHFVCLGHTQKAHKILVNYADIKYIPRMKKCKFVSWNDYILRSSGIRRITDRNEIGSSTQPLFVRSEPNETADTLTIPAGFEMFCPIRVKGDWVKVSYDCFYNDESNRYEGEPCHNYIDKCKNPVMGWLKWRQDSNILIDILLMP